MQVECRIGKREVRKIVGWARHVEIVFNREPCNQIERAGAIEVICFRTRSADAGGPPIGILKDEQRHSVKKKRPSWPMSPSSYAVFRGFTFIAASQLFPPWTFGVSLSFKLMELI